MITLLALLLSSPVHAEVKTDAEAGVVITNGNSQTQSYSVKDKNSLVLGPTSYVFTGSYLKSRSGGIKSAESWLLGLRFEQALNEKLSLFIGQSVEGDEFAGYRQRYNSDLGAKYYFMKTEKDLIWFGEGGYRYTYENTTANVTLKQHKARLYTEAEKFFNESVSSKLWIEYLPNFTVSQAWQLNSELSLSAAMSSVFALKSGILMRYNNLPPKAGAQKADTTFTTALTAKF